jgi:hypothetical protein
VEKRAASYNLPHVVFENRFEWKLDWWKKCGKLQLARLFFKVKPICEQTKKHQQFPL